jgi:hypothetical protein
MKTLLDKLTRRTKAATMTETSSSAATADTEAQIQRIDDAVEAAHSAAAALDAQRRDAEALAARLMAEAAAGTLSDPQRLADALRRQRELAQAPDPREQVQAFQAQREALEQRLYAARRADATQRYSDAVVAFAAAYAQIIPLAMAVRELANDAGVTLTPSNSPALPEVGVRHVVVGGAVVDFPRG